MLMRTPNVGAGAAIAGWLDNRPNQMMKVSSDMLLVITNYLERREAPEHEASHRYSDPILARLWQSLVIL